MSDEIKTTTTYEVNILDYISRINALDNYSLRQIFLLLIRNLYSDNSQFSSLVSYFPNSMKDYTYSDPIVDPKKKSKSTLQIELSYAATVDSPDKKDYLAVNQYPAIFISVGDLDYESTGAISHAMGYDRAMGTVTQGMVTKCPITISHYAEDYDTAAILSQITSSYFLVLRKPLMNKLGLKSLDLAKTAAPIPASQNFQSEAEKLFKADIHLALTFVSQWETTPESVKIKKFSVQLETPEGRVQKI